MPEADDDETEVKLKRLIAGVRKRVAEKLEGFSADFPDGLDPWSMSSSRPDAQDFPVPELVLFTLRNLMGWRWRGPGEKVRWTVLGSVAGEPVAFEHRKFGFTILRHSDGKVSNSRIIGQLKRALKETEDLLEPLAEAQIHSGEVLIVNRFGEFDGRYHFFRGKAEAAYRRAETLKGAPLKEPKAGRLPNLASGLNRVMRANREGFFHSTAMVDSYFSALEHRLVLLRAFTGIPLRRGEVIQLLSAGWDDKLKQVLPVTGNRAAELVLGKMRRIKERIRNPFAHGGVENDGGSLFFDLPGIGPIPANFSRFGESVRFSFLPIEADDHAEACAVFDELDELLSNGVLAGPNRLLDAGVDPSFDANTLQRYAQAIEGGAEALEAFIDAWGDAWMRHANMDY